MTIEYRRLLSGDEAVLGNVADDVFDEPIRGDRVERYFAQPGHLMMVALDEGVVVAQCAAVVHRHPDKVTELYVDELGTATSYRRRGIARTLLRLMFEWGIELGCKESWLGTEMDNEAANALYRAAGGETTAMAYYEFMLVAEGSASDL